MSPMPRSRPASGIRGSKRPIGEKQPIADAQPAENSAPTATASRPSRTAKPAATKPSPRPPASTRIAVDVPDDLGDRFRRRAKAMRFTQSDALTGALELLEELDDEAYLRALMRVR
jgi:hypothetical protein